MYYHCPTCGALLGRRSLLLKAVTTCDSCGEQSCLGNFSQYLGASLAAFFAGGATIFFASAIGPASSVGLAVSVALAVLLVGVLIFMKPVAYRRSKWHEKIFR
jgi:hypothetical protein